MNIYAPRGSKVVYLDKHGYSNDTIWAREKGLIKHQVYTISRTDVHSSSTTIYLEEFPGIPLNSVMFDDLKEFQESKEAAEENELLSRKMADIPNVPLDTYGTFKVQGQCDHDFECEVFAINRDMTIATGVGAIYVTKEQAMAFFDLVPRTN